jgi:hypothetical protein
MVRDLATGDVRTVLQVAIRCRRTATSRCSSRRTPAACWSCACTRTPSRTCSPDEYAGLSVEHVTPHDGPAQYLPAGWTPEGIFLSTTQGRDHLGLALLTPGDGLQWLDTPAADIDCAAVSGDGKRLVWSVNTIVRGVTREVTLDVTSEGTGADPWGNDRMGFSATAKLDRKEFGGRGGPEFARRQSCVGREHTAGSPARRRTAATEVWVADLSNGCARQPDALQRTASRPSAEPEVIHYPSTDGLTVSGLLYRPPARTEPGQGPRPDPVVLDIHGGPEYQALPLFSPLIQALVACAVSRYWRPTSGGSCGYGQHYQRLIYRDWGGGDLQDLAAAGDYLRGQD